ncbi:MAG: outer membrane protein assembly factor BamE [Kordiimonadaceae bacterium]|nr:outer membrane protein assembly factor BamE [Kordiimonadaceae bacterium]
MSFGMPNIFSKKLPLALLLTGSLALTACGNRQQIRGYIFDKELASAILAGVDNRQSVQSTLGTPTTSATFDNDTWYYISTTVRTRPVFWAEPQQHQVLAVHFNDKGVVDNINNYDLSHVVIVSPVSDKTPTKGRTLSFFAQIFGSVGRFGAQAPVGSGENRGPNG